MLLKHRNGSVLRAALELTPMESAVLWDCGYRYVLLDGCNQWKALKPFPEEGANGHP